jgi:hypothetical protein
MGNSYKSYLCRMEIHDWKKRIPADFADEARVWIYQSSRPFNEQEEREIEEQLYQFYTQWLSHGDQVKGWSGLFFHQFIVIMADETETAVGGCSTDSSVRMIKSIERQYNVQMFDRMTITFLMDEKPQMLPYGQIQYAIDNGYIRKDTLMFDNTLTSKQALLSRWLTPLAGSWLAGRVNLNQDVYATRDGE